eukprot:2010776-Pyramimonas_sp.AAC.1
MDDEVCGDGGDDGAEHMCVPALRPMHRGRLVLEGNSTVFFIFGESGGLWSKPYRRASPPS